MVTSLLHMGIQINSFKKALEFFCDGLGMEKIYTGTIGEFRHIIDPSVDPATDPREQMGYVRVCEGQYFEMFEGIVTPPVFEPEPINKYDDMSFVEIGLGVADMKDAVRRIAERGLDVKDGCLYDADENCFRLVETGGEIRKHIITSLAYVAFKVNDIDAAVDFYSKLGLVPNAPDEKGNVKMDLKNGSIILVKSDAPVVKHPDTTLYHMAYGTDSFEQLQKSSAEWEAAGIVSYRNVNKDEILKTDPEHFDPDQGPDGSIGTRVFDPDDNYAEIIFMPEDNRQNVFDRTHPFD